MAATKNVAALVAQVRRQGQWEFLADASADDHDGVRRTDYTVLDVLRHDGRPVRVVWFNGENDQHVLYEVTPITDWPGVVILNRPGYGGSWSAEVGHLEGDEHVKIARLSVSLTQDGVQTTSFGHVTAAEARTLGTLYRIAADYLTRRQEEGK